MAFIKEKASELKEEWFEVPLPEISGHGCSHRLIILLEQVRELRAGFRGKLEGNITGREVVLTATARMTGDITHEVLSLEPGARFAGAVKHVEHVKPQAAAVPAPKLPSPAV
jgi:hypothetical protein